MKVETAKTCLILLLMAYAIETWPWVQKSFQAQEIIDADAKLRNGVRSALEQAYQESIAAQKNDGMDKIRADQEQARLAEMGEIGAKLREHGLRQIEGADLR